jgi:hypothetical protein
MEYRQQNLLKNLPYGGVNSEGHNPSLRNPETETCSSIQKNIVALPPEPKASFCPNGTKKEELEEVAQALSCEKGMDWVKLPQQRRRLEQMGLWEANSVWSR